MLIPKRRFSSPKENMFGDLLLETIKLGCKPSKVPIEQNQKIRSEKSTLIEKTQ